MAEQSAPPNRRSILKSGLVLGAAAAPAAPQVSSAAPPPPSKPGPSPWTIAAETRLPNAAEAGALESPAPAHVIHPGSDFMVDVMKAAGIKYVAAMPGSTFRGLHESIINYGANHAPELIDCTHEEVSAGICHGYAKVAGAPMACMVHNNVGLQHASMAVYNAWCDRAPMMIIAANVADATLRRTGVEWLHTSQDVAAMVRDFVKWDDAPASLQHYAESFMRAHAISMTPPCEPVLIVADGQMQELPAPNPHLLRIPARAPVAPPAAAASDLARAAALLAQAQNPVIVADRAARTPEGLRLLVRLAETLNAPVIDRLGRMNFPTNHDLNHTWLQGPLIANADVILSLELTDLFGLTHAVLDVAERRTRRLIKADAKVIAMSATYAYMKSNMQDMERYFAADLTIAADAEASLPGLIEAVNAEITPARRRQIAARRAPLTQNFQRMRQAAIADAARGWDASPVSTARLCQELWEQIKTENWGLVSSSDFVSRWPQRLWDMTEHHHYIGGEGGYGVGYGICAAAGAALAQRDAGRIAVNIQTDGDLLVAPGALWTLAHHSIPLLTIMHNNRAWHQETMHVQRVANRRDRDPERGMIGTVLTEPTIDYAMLARSMGVWAEGPIADPNAVGPAIARALAVVKAGAPALVDVVTQPR